MCGSIADGASFSAMEGEHIKTLLSIAQNPSEEQRLKALQATPDPQHLHNHDVLTGQR
jgi:hypothetical protein